MRVCESCKVQISDGLESCPRCGRSVPRGASADAASHVSRLLTEANLHKVRGAYGVAVDKCTEALQLQPHEAEIHALLGDIYEGQGNLEEAARWYQMAVDLRPNCVLDQARLSRVTSRLARTKRGERELTTGYWLQPSLGGNKIDTIIRYVVVFCVVAVLVLIIIGLAGWLIRGKAPQSVATNQPAAGGKLPSQGQAIPGQQTVAPTETPVTSTPANDMLVRPIAEQQILSNLATNPEVLQQRLVVEDVKSDPRKRSLEVTFRFSDAPTALTRLVVRRSAAVVASATFAASPETSLVTVRAIVNVPGKYSAGEPRLVLVSGAPKEITGIDLGRASDEQLDTILSDEWWGPEIAP